MGRILICSLVALLLPSAASAAAPPPAVPGEVIVRYADGVSGARREALRDVVQARGTRPAALPRAEVLRLPAGQSVVDAVRTLSARSDVVWAEPNRRYRLAAVPSDRRFPEQWGLRNVGQEVDGMAGLVGADIDALGAWSVTTGSAAVTVAVLDSGVRPEHPDLVGRVLPGRDFVREDDDPRDDHGHGTAVAGIIAARADSEGVIGVAPGVRILPVQVFGSDGFATASDIADGITYAGNNGARIANLSFGGQFSQLIADAIWRQPGILFVVAAGNDGRDIDGPNEARGWPCRLPLPNVVCVAASTAGDTAASFSNTGPVSVDLAAPGKSIVAPALRDHALIDDDFETPLGSRWTTGGPEPRWERAATADGHALALAPEAADAPGSERWIETATAWSDADWASGERCHLDFDVDYDPRPGDWLELQRFYNGTWRYMNDYRGEEGGRVHVSDPIDSGYFSALRFVVHVNIGGASDRSGVRIDDLFVGCGGREATADIWRPWDGTSFSAPHAAGVAALVLSARPTATTGHLRSALVCGAEPVAAFAGRTVTGGRLDAAGALAARLGPEQPRTSGMLTRLVEYGEVWGVAALPDGGFLFTLPFDGVVRRMRPDGQVVAFAGNGDQRDTGDGGPATAAGLRGPGQLLRRADGSVLVLGGTRLRLIHPDGTITTVAGGDEWGHTGDGGPASEARLARAIGIGEGPDGSIYVAESEGAIRRIDPAGTITTVASLSPYIYGFTVEPDGAFLVGIDERIVRVRPGTRQETVAGTGLRGWSGDGGPATAARIAAPLGIAVAPDGIYVAESANAVVRLIGNDGRIETVAGVPAFFGSTAEETPALAAQIGETHAVAVLASGDLAVGTRQGIYRFDHARVPMPPLPPACADAGDDEPAPASQRTEPASSPPPAAAGPRAGRPLEAGAVRLRGRTLTLSVTCAEPCTVRLRVVAEARTRRPRTIASARRRLAAGVRTTLRLTLPRAELRRVRRAGGRLVVRVDAASPGLGTHRVTRRAAV